MVNITLQLIYIHHLSFRARNSRRSREFLSGLYPALGRADARNEEGDAPLSPPCDPPSGKVFSTKIIFNKGRFIFIIQTVKIHRELLLITFKV